MEDDFVPRPNRVCMTESQAKWIVGRIFDRRPNQSRQWDEVAEETAARHVRRRAGVKKKRGSDFTLGPRAVSR